MSKKEEYQTIRDEMLQKFKRTEELLIFSVTSTAVLLAWLVTQIDNASIPSPFVFTTIGLIMIAYFFYLFLITIRQIYHQGGYLSAFHETAESGLTYHTLTRFFDYFKKGNKNQKIKSRWGRNGKIAAIILLLLTILNSFGPLFLFSEEIIKNPIITIQSWIDNLNQYSTQLFFFTITIVVVCIIFIEIYFLWTTKTFMEKDLLHWLEIAKELEKKPNFLINGVNKNEESDNAIFKYTNKKNKEEIEKLEKTGFKQVCDVEEFRLFKKLK